MSKVTTKAFDQLCREKVTFEHGYGLKMKEVSADDLLILLGLLEQAGFKPKSLSQGLLKDGSDESGGHIINYTSRHYVIGQDGEADITATKWLNEVIVWNVSPGFILERELEGIILRAQPLLPIELGSSEHVLLEPQKSGQRGKKYLCMHTRETDPLGDIRSTIVGIHGPRCGCLLVRIPC